MTKINISKRQKIYLTVGVMLILVVAIFFLLIYPTFQKIKTKSTEIEDNQATIQQYSDETDNLESIRQQFSSVSKETYLKLLPNQEQVINFVIQLEDVARETNNQITINTETSVVSDTQKARQPSVNVDQKDKDKQDQDVISLTLDLKGSFENIARFFSILENSDYLITIDSFKISRASSDSDGLELEEDNAAEKEDSSSLLDAQISLTLRVTPSEENKE